MLSSTIVIEEKDINYGMTAGGIRIDSRYVCVNIGNLFVFVPNSDREAAATLFQNLADACRFFPKEQGTRPARDWVESIPDTTAYEEE